VRLLSAEEIAAEQRVRELSKIRPAEAAALRRQRQRQAAQAPVRVRTVEPTARGYLTRALGSGDR
jgi:hypothetical protein